MSHDSAPTVIESRRRALMTLGAALLVSATATPDAQAQEPKVTRVLIGDPVSINAGDSIRMMTFNSGAKPVGGALLLIELRSGERIWGEELQTLPGRTGHAVDVPLTGPLQFVSIWRLTGAAGGAIASLEVRDPNGAKSSPKLQEAEANGTF